jgi:hypothetical protein
MSFRYAVIATASTMLAVAVAGCGGGDSETSGSAATTGTISTTTTESETGEGESEASEEMETDDAGEDASASADDAGDLAQGTGRVTIGGTTWDIVADIQCLNFGVALGFQGHAADDPNVRVSLDANTDDPTVASASVEVGEEASWRAGPEYVSLGATVPETTTDDGYGTGAATFVNTLNPDPGTGTYETAAGTYEFYCE